MPIKKLRLRSRMNVECYPSLALGTANGHLHPVPDAGLPPKAAKVAPAVVDVIVVVFLGHFDILAVGDRGRRRRLGGVRFGGDPRLWARLRLLLLVRKRGRMRCQKRRKVE